MKPAYTCSNNAIKLASGKYFDLTDPQPDQFEVEDIGIALSRICRFGGHCRTFYSVAEHSWHAYDQGTKDAMPADALRALLMHDAAEAFIGDVVKPLKEMLPDYLEVEQRVEAVIAYRFDIDFDKWGKVIAEIDHALLIAERSKLFDADGVEWAGENKAKSIHFQPMCLSSVQAAMLFVKTAHRLEIID